MVSSQKISIFAKATTINDDNDNDNQNITRIMRRSRKSEYRRGVNEGMLNTFFSVTYLNNQENIEARKAIAIKSGTVFSKTWESERPGLRSLDDAYLRGFSVGMDGWESDEEINQVVKMAKISAITK